jgi:multidrug efflux pump subunit AcrA (membrane-fusion protein)
MTKLLVVLVLALAMACTPDRTPSDAAPPTAAATLYQCPMHPQVIRSEPGSCPICGMALQRLDDRAEPSGTPRAHDDHVAVDVPVARQQLIGITRATVSRRPLVRTIRAAARIANDPDLYQLLVEHREATRTRALVAGSVTLEARDAATRLVEASRLRLRRAGVDADALGVLAAHDPTSLILPGPQVWAYAHVFEDDVPLIRPGAPLTVVSAAFPDRRYDGRVIAIDPTVDPGSRSVRIRALVTTPDAALRPDAYVTATFVVSLGDALAVPRDAILVTGERRLAFVITGETRFEPREVTVGQTTDTDVEVLAGLAPGDTVVTSANFLIDSESRLRAAVAAFGHVHDGADR